jgi:hypothetical protein
MPEQPETRNVILALTEDELTILHYVVPHDTHGDPLKDTYELGDAKPDDPYATLGTLRAKLNKISWADAAKQS